MKICGSSVPFHVRKAVPALPFRQRGSVSPFGSRCRKHRSERKSTVFCQPAAISRLSPLLPADNETWDTEITDMPIKKPSPHSPFFIP